MQVQTFLQDCTARGLSSTQALADLERLHAIRHTLHDMEPLVILNYDQIESKKTDPIVRECRALTMEMGSWRVVARSFPRFFNFGECPEEDCNFEWWNCTCTSKEDGSLMLLYYYNGSWRVNTRGSFAKGRPSELCSWTWEELFYSAMDFRPSELLRYATYVFEFCSPWNKVVRQYEKPTLYLLAMFLTQSGHELPSFLCHDVAERLKVNRPEVHHIRQRGDLEDLIAAEDDPTFEGFVCKSPSGTRIKVKNPRYVALHHMRGEGNLTHLRHLFPFVIRGEQAEVTTYFPEAFDAIWGLTNEINYGWGELLLVWEENKHLPSQKEFALAVLPRTRFASVLFVARRTGVELDDVRDVYHELIRRGL